MLVLSTLPGQPDKAVAPWTPGAWDREDCRPRHDCTGHGNHHSNRHCRGRHCRAGRHCWAKQKCSHRQTNIDPPFDCLCHGDDQGDRAEESTAQRLRGSEKGLSCHRRDSRWVRLTSLHPGWGTGAAVGSGCPGLAEGTPCQLALLPSK